MINGSAINSHAINAAGGAQLGAAYILDGASTVDSSETEYWTRMLESLTVTGTWDINYAIRNIEQFTVAANMATFYNPQAEITNQISTADLQNVVTSLQLTEQFTAGDTPSFVYVALIAEALVATGTVQTFYHGVLEVLSSLTVGDSNRAADSASVTDSINIATLAVQAAFVAQLIDSLTVAATTQNTMTILVEETAALTAGDSVELTASMLAELLDTVEVQTLLKTPSEIAQGWLLNTEADMPISEYDNFVFDSLTQYRGSLYGTSDTGLYIMGAETDAGDPITSQISSLMLDFGTSRQKRIRSAYLGYTSENEMVLKVRSVSDGELFEHWFKACPVTADAPREGRINVGRGLRSRYWQFELTNIDGGDFEIDQLEMHPLMLSRRV